MNFLRVSIGKDNLLNEDSIIADSTRIAVSDGAGGGGLFADRWSAYLLNKLPPNPIHSFEVLDEWVESIWESFYSQYEAIAKSLGAVELNKFYDEGSLATLAVLWLNGNGVEWMSYGDSAVFCYDFKSKELLSNIVNPQLFNETPFLINVNAPLCDDGFKCGTFPVSETKWYFCATDALAHYIIASYMVANKSVYQDSLHESVNSRTKNSNFIRAILSESNIDFEKDVMMKLFNCAKNQSNFARHIKKLQRMGKLAYDDYSIAFLY